MYSVFKHELIHPSITCRHEGYASYPHKSVLADVITEDIECQDAMELQKSSSCLIIDGAEAMVVALGKARQYTDLWRSG